MYGFACAAWLTFGLQASLEEPMSEIVSSLLMASALQHNA